MYTAGVVMENNINRVLKKGSSVEPEGINSDYGSVFKKRRDTQRKDH